MQLQEKVAAVKKASHVILLEAMQLRSAHANKMHFPNVYFSIRTTTMCLLVGSLHTIHCKHATSRDCVFHFG